MSFESRGRHQRSHAVDPTTNRSTAKLWLVVRVDRPTVGDPVSIRMKVDMMESDANISVKLGLRVGGRLNTNVARGDVNQVQENPS
ncbi:hypothetical protein BHM03_00030607 [Ensete ventricosum]|nr:hypothetical protein BHM03_00030607 [Ensete ventricosum]